MGFEIKNGVLQKYIHEKPSEEIVIPENVTEIGANVFIGNKTLRRVQFPDGLLKIGDGAFYGCTGLKEITLPEGLTSIGIKAFGACKGLYQVHLPDSIQEIGSNAFDGTAWLEYAELLLICGDILICYSGAEEELILPAGLRVIGANALKRQHRPRGRDVLRRVVIPEGVEAIGAQAFRDNSALEEVVLPNSLKTLGESVFINCTNLRKVNLPEGLTEIPHNLFYGCQNLSEIRIPETVREIGANAFYFCISLSGIHFPEGLAVIGETAFAKCSQLDGVEIPAQTTEIGANAFQDTYWETAYPDDFIIHGDLLLKYKGNAQKVTIPAYVRRIGDRAFEGRKVTAVQLPPQLAEIGAYAFSQCAMLDQIVFPDTVKRIGMCAFGGCRSLKEIGFAGELPISEKEAFIGLEKLERIVTPGGKLELANYLPKTVWGSYHLDFVRRILCSEIRKTDIRPNVIAALFDLYEITKAGQLAKLIKKFAEQIFIKLDQNGSTECICYLLAHKEFLTERTLNKILEYAITVSQKGGPAEHQMLVMRAKDTFFGAKQKKFVL